MSGPENMAEGTGQGTEAEIAPQADPGQIPARQNIVESSKRSPLVEEFDGFDKNKLNSYQHREIEGDERHMGLFDPQLTEVDPVTGESRPKMVARIQKIAGGSQQASPEEINRLQRLIDEYKQRPEFTQEEKQMKSMLIQGAEKKLAQLLGIDTTPIQTQEPGAVNSQNGGNDGSEGETQAGGGNNGQENPPGRPPEGLGPEGLDWGPEWETSPERGSMLAELYVWYRTTMPYEVLYNAENGPKFRQLCNELQAYVDAICKIRNERDPWEPRRVYEEIREEFENQANQPDAHDQPPEIPDQVQGNQDQEEESPQPHQLPRIEPDPQSREDAEYLASLSVEEHQQVIAALTAAYENDDTPASTLAEIRQRLAIYFREAKRKELLDGAEDLLNTAYQKHIQAGDVDIEEATELVRQTVAKAAEDIRDLWRAGRSADPEIERLKGIWRPYTNWAREIFRFAIRDQEAPNSLKERGAFAFVRHELEEGRETYWRPSSWTGYYTISAKTPEQFRTAAETFLQMIRLGHIGKSPDDLYKHLQNFKEAFGAAGTIEIALQKGKKKDKGERLTANFLKELRLEFEALSYIFGADYSNETYNPKSYNQFMMAMALHEGPDRWVRLARAGGGQVGAFTFMFDKEPLMEIFNNPVGQRGELDIITQHFVRDQVREKAIERGMGIRLKDYDPREDATNLANYERYKDQDIQGLPVAMRRSINLGRIQAELRNIQSRIANGEITLEANQGEIDFLSSEDRKLYLSSLTKSRSASKQKENLERIGLHMPDEVFKDLYEGFDDSNAHIHNFRRFRSLNDEELNKLPISLRKSINLGRIQIELQNIRARIRSGEEYERGKTAVELLNDADREIYLTVYEQADANFDVAFQMQGASGEKVRKGKGFFYVDRNPHFRAYQEVQEKGDSKLTLKQKREKWNDSQWLGYILTKLKNRGELEKLSLVERKFYQGLGVINKEGQFIEIQTSTEGNIIPTNKDREAIVDNIPAYLAEDAVQTVVNIIKIQHANSPAKLRKAAVLRAEAYSIRQIQLYGFEAKFVVPKIVFNTDPNSPNFGDVIGEDGVETIDLMAAAKSIYARYTTHTYWGYQGENRHMLLRPHIFEAARRVRAGLSRPEDEDMLATQLLITDPTLKRVAKLDTDQVEEEITLLQAAVEESYQTRKRINRGLFREFLPKSGHRGKMRAGYNMEDWGGMMRFTMGIKELTAAQPSRFARRLGAEIANMPMEIDSMPAIWAQNGVLGAVNMFADQIKHIAHQGVVGQFGITKFIDQMDYGVEMFNALIGWVDSQGKVHVEGLYMKPTNDNDKLNEFFGEKQALIVDKPNHQMEFLNELRKVFGRLERVMKLMRVTYSDVRNAGGALDLQEIDIFLEDGEYNNEEISTTRNTGTSRHSEKIFFDGFMQWLISEQAGGGANVYPNEVFWNAYINNVMWIIDKKSGKAIPDPTGRTFKDWLFDKMGL